MTPRRALFAVALVPLTAALGLAVQGNTAAGAFFGAMACLLALVGMAAPDDAEGRAA